MPFETFVLGLAVALLFIEATGIYPGGIIVPAFHSIETFRLTGFIK